MDDSNKAPQQSTPAEQKPAQVPAPETATPTPTTPTVAQTPMAGGGGSKKKSQMLIAGIVAALLVAGAIAYGVYAYVTNTPDYLISKSVEQLGQETAIAAKFKFTSGTDSNGVNFSGDFAARGDKASKNGEAVIGIGTGDSRVTVSARVIDETTYLRFGSLANFGNLAKTFSTDQASVYNSADFKAALARVDNKWFSLTKEEMSALAESTTTKSNVNSVKPEDLQKTLDIYNKHPFFKADKVYNDEDVDGVKTAHFTVKMDKAAYKAFLNEVKSANMSSIKVTDSDINNADKDVDDFAKNAAVDMWVTRDTKKLKQLKFASLEKGNEGSLTLTFVTNLPTFDKLEKPSDSKPFSEFMTTLLGPSLSTPTYDDSYYMAQ